MMDRDRELHEMADDGRALMSGEYIKRADALKIVENNLSRFMIALRIGDCPSADVAPVRHGRWEPYSIEPEVYDIAGVKSWAKKYRCSECRFLHTVIEDFGIYTFCPNCGTRMDGEDDETDRR